VNCLLLWDSSELYVTVGQQRIVCYCGAAVKCLLLWDSSELFVIVGQQPIVC